ncbi:MAG: cation diffusion facilitator family transporter [Alphaproteobacteria bacterium]|nr:cation diffusion facilitator family transporter [Alphaproteobacteria bacterium]
MTRLKNEHLIRLATYGAVGVASILVCIKTYAWYVSGSLSIQASLIDSSLDACASLVNFFALRHALRPADADHRFGHGKAESLSSLGQSVFIAIASIWIAKEVIYRTAHPEPFVFNSTTLIVMVFASFLTLMLILGQQYVIKRTGSLGISADSLHYKTDFLTDLSVLGSFFISTYFGWRWFDTLVGALIALYIFHSSWRIAKDAFDVLMDKELPPDILARITAIVLQNPEVLGVHDLRTRTSGQYKFIQLHLDLDEALSFKEAHRISEDVMNAINTEFPDAEVLVHQDPILTTKE